MNSIKNILGFTALVWWCVLYPELCFPQDTYEVVYETNEAGMTEAESVEYESIEAQSIGADSEERADYPTILQADDEQIVVKSRLLEWLGWEF